MYTFYCQSSMDPDQEVFKNHIYRRIQLAAAIYVIKSTPKGTTPEAHAVDLQMRLRTFWLNSSSPQDDSSTSYHSNQLILSQQQHLLSSRLLSVVSETSNQFAEGFSYELQNCTTNSGLGKHELSKKFQAYYNSLSKNKKTLANNASFIHAIIQLKALAQAKSTVPMKKYISSVRNLPMGNRTLGPPSSADTPQLPLEPLASSEDSGFHTVVEDYDHPMQEVERNECSVTSVASSILLYIINSCNVDQLLVKSIQAIVNQFKAIAYQKETVWAISNLDERINQWVGSIHQQAIMALHSIIRSQNVHAINSISFCYQECLSFIQEMILQIMKETSSDQDEYCVQENQISLVLQICEGTTLWSQAVEIIFSYLMEFLDKIKRANEDVYLSKQGTAERKYQYFQEQSEEIERNYFLVLLAKTFLDSTNKHLSLLRELDNLDSATTSRPVATEQARNTLRIADLWRKHYSVQVNSHNTVSSSEDRYGRAKADVKRWVQILHDSFSCVPLNFSLLSVLLVECVPFSLSFSEELQ